MRHGRLVGDRHHPAGCGAATLRRRADATAETVLARQRSGGATAAASAEEIECVLRWLEPPGVRLVEVDGSWSVPAYGAGGQRLRSTARSSRVRSRPARRPARPAAGAPPGSRELVFRGQCPRSSEDCVITAIVLVNAAVDRSPRSPRPSPSWRVSPRSTRSLASSTSWRWSGCASTTSSPTSSRADEQGRRRARDRDAHRLSYLLPARPRVGVLARPRRQLTAQRRGGAGSRLAAIQHRAAGP